jgi:uracil-DNA glycosylase family 4
MDAKLQLAVIREQWSGCKRCKLQELRGPDDKVVIGGGSAPADFLFVYDAPEMEDMLSGFPLSGRLGGILANLMIEAEIPTGSFAITTLVGCRPYVVLPAVEDKPAQIRDRASATEEREACTSRLSSLIYVIDPQLIFAVGKEAWETLVRPKDRDGKRDFAGATGTLFYSYVEGHTRSMRYPVMAIPHPKDIIANPSSAQHGPIVIATEALIRGAKYVETLNKEMHG